MAKLWKILMALLLVATLYVPNASAASAIDDVRSIIKENYYDINKLTEADLNAKTIDEIVSKLDRFSSYFTQEELDDFTNGIDMEFVGIGIMVNENAKGVEVLSVFPNSPAEKAGLEPGDVITEADGTVLSEIALELALQKIKGVEGSSVSVKILRPSTNETFLKTMVRAKISMPTVEYKMLAGNIGYVRLHSFSEDAATKMMQAITALKGTKGWIVDFRDNGGGYVSAASEVGGLFSSVKKLTIFEDNMGFRMKENATPQLVQFTGPTALLINGFSASASEMVAGAVKDQNGAVVYGQNSYGKGSMQQIYSVANETAYLKLTIAHFYSPNGTEIHGVGVKPNVVTKENEELVVSHLDILKKQWKNYSKLSTLQNVAPNKTFTIKLSSPMNLKDLQATQAIQLLHLGGEVVPVTLTANGTTGVTVTPKETLRTGEQYVLVVHPQLKNAKGKAMSKGSYAQITVKP